jgi:4-aminobutyrate aminotransferase-like enzyme
VLRISPPLIASEADVDEAVGKLDESFTAIRA